MLKMRVKNGIYSLILILSAPIHAQSTQSIIIEKQISRQLNQLHQFAGEAKGKDYFALFSESAVFIGTDPSETWSIKEFKAYALPFFNHGKGWEYQPKDRHIYLSKNGQVAWFDELLDNQKYGLMRGSGVLQKYPQGWKIESL